MHRAVSSFQYAPDTLICLGQLITSPRQPYRRLAPPLLPLPSEPIISPVTTWSFTSSETNGGSASVFAHFLQLFTASVSGHAARELAQSWSAARLETRFLELGPAGDSENDYVRRSVSEVESVCEWLKVNRRLGKTIYMVTGVKVAMQPGEAKSGVSRTKGVEVAVSGDPGTGGVVEVGVGGAVERGRGSEQTATPVGDFVFAYRLRKVHVSWRGKVRLGDDVVKADLYGDEDFGGHDGHDGDDDDDGDDEEEEIDEVEMEDEDFGARLPEWDLKTEGIDEADGEDCLVVIPAEEE